jgi:hypothetical protein
MWNVKSLVIPVITGATVIVTGTSKKNLEVTRKTFTSFTVKDSCTGNITHNMERSQSRGDHCWFQRSSTREKRPATVDGDEDNSNNNSNNNKNVVVVVAVEEEEEEEGEVSKCPQNTLSDVLCVLCSLDLKFVNNCKINTAGKITLNVSFHVKNTPLFGFRWVMFPVSAVYFSGSPCYKNRFAL